jgi:hypothetical protein
MVIKILIISDGRLGDRAFETILTRNPATEMIVLDVPDASIMVEKFRFDDDSLVAISSTELLISYLRHPDVTLELCTFRKPTILAYYLGEGLLKQAQEVNPDVIMPASMCRLEPDTGIPIIDEFARYFGLPGYQMELECIDGAWRFKKITLVTESPCGSSRRALLFLEDAFVTPATINAFAMNIAQDCKESVAYQLAKSDSSDTAALNHVIPLLNAIEDIVPDLFFESGLLHDYAAEKRNAVRNIPAFSKK